MEKIILLIAFFFLFSIKINSQVVAAAQFNSTVFCGLNDTLRMQDVSTGAVINVSNWTVTGPFGFSPALGFNTNFDVALTHVGLYTIELQSCDAFANCNTITYTDIVEVKATAVASFTFNSQCSGMTNNFIGDFVPNIALVNNFNWNFDEGAGYVSGNSNQQYNFNSSGNKTVAFEIVLNNGCRDTAFQNIMVSEKPTAIIQLTDTLVCVGNSVVINGGNSIVQTPGANYYWDEDYNTGIDNTNSAFIILANANKTVMLIVEDDNSCRDTAFQDLTIIQVPDASFEVEAHCEGEPFDLISTSSFIDSPIDSVYWYVDSAAYLEGDTASYTHPNKDSVQVILFVINENGCEDAYLKYLQIEEKPEININIEKQIVCKGNEIELIAEGASTYKWIPSDVEGDVLKVSPEESSTYFVEGYSQNGGCVSLDSSQLILQNSVYIPNIFTPNNDQIFDEFTIRSNCLELINTFTIFDRSGREMFHQENIGFFSGLAKTEWNGNSKSGLKCNPGVYVYNYEVTDYSGNTHKGFGNITLMR